METFFLFIWNKVVFCCYFENCYFGGNKSNSFLFFYFLYYAKKIWNIQVIRYFLKKIWELKWYAFFTIIWVIIVTVNWLLIPIYFKEIIDIISLWWDKIKTMSDIQKYFIYFVITAIVTSITWRWLDYVLSIGSHKLDYNISVECFSYIHKHSYNFLLIILRELSIKK